MIKKTKTIFFLTLMLLSITGYAQVTDPNTKVKWLEGSWGARLYVRGGPQLDQYVDTLGYDYVAGAEEMVAKYTTMGHVLTNMTQNARTNKFTLRYNPNVHAVTGNPNFVISDEFVPSLKNEQVIIDVIKVFKDAGKKVLLYLNCKEFTAVDTSEDAFNDWYAYVNQYFGGDEYAARTNLMEGYMKRFKEMGVDGYWLDAAAMNERNLQLVAMMRALDPNMIFSINTDKSVFKNPDGSNMTVLLDGCDDDDPDPYGVIKYAMNDVEGDFTGGHIFPLGQGGRGDSWAHEEFTIPDIQEDNYQLFEGKNILKHMFMPMRQQWSVANATLRMTNEVAYRMVKKITMAGGAITFSGTTTDGTIIADEDAVLTYVNQKMQQNEIDFDPYVRPACAFLAGEEARTAQSINFPSISSKAVGSADFDPGATASSGFAVSYISSNPAVATIVNNKVRIVGPGLTRITARQNGNTNYRHAPFKHQMLTVTGGSTGGGGDNLALNGTASQSDTLNGRGPELAIDGNTNGNYGGGSVTASLGTNAWWEVDLGDEYSIDDINVFNRSNSCCVDRLSNFTVLVKDSNGTVTYSETVNSAPNPSETLDAGGATGQVVRIESNTGLTLNLAEVEVFGTENTKLDQTITFSDMNKQVGDADFDPATASSGYNISYTSSNTNVATIVNGNIRIEGVGTSQITASQAGNVVYNAAPSVTRTLTVTEGNTGGGTNLALNGTASQSDTLNGRGPELAIDGNTNGNYSAGSVTVAAGPTAWWEVDLGGSYSIDDINVFNRTNSCCIDRLSNFTVQVKDSNGNVTFSETITTAPNPSETVDAGGAVGQIVRIQSNITSNLNLAEVEVYGEPATTTNAFVPDPNKTYYIDCPQWNLRLAASGESEDAYTTSTSTTGADVEWKFVSNGNGYWHLDRAAGGTKPRLRTDGTADADMNQTTANGTNTYYSFSEGNSNGTYLLTIPDGTVDYNRLQIDNTGAVKMVGTSSTGSWVSFTITETAPVSCASFSRIQAENYNSMSGVVDEGINIGFIENGDWAMYSNVDLTCANSIDVRASSNTSGGNVQVRLGSPTGTLIGTVPVSNTGGWGTYTTVGSTVSSVSGTHDVYLVFTGGSGYLFNLNWVEFDGTSSSKSSSEKGALDIEASDAEGVLYVYPNPVKDILNVKISGSKAAKLDVINFAGQRVLSQDIRDTNTAIDVSNLATGIYMLKVTDEQQYVQTKKIIKQ